MENILRVGLIQPVVDPGSAWNETPAFISTHTIGSVKPSRLNIDPITAERVWQEILSGLSSLLHDDNIPNIILIPELHLPSSRISELKRIGKQKGIIIIAGLDFQRNPVDARRIRNRGAIIIPGSLEGEPTNRQTTLYFGKTYFTYMERQMFQNIEGLECIEDQEQNMYIFQTEKYGRFGIVICSDIFDIERMILYQGKIHHLFVISLNKDLNTYFAMAETLTRLLYCNVVICNSGQYGGSLAFSPYDDPNERVIYKYYGQRVPTTHQVSLPVKALEQAQRFDFVNGDKKKNGIKFKASPPGYYDKFAK